MVELIVAGICLWFLYHIVRNMKDRQTLRWADSTEMKNAIERLEAARQKVHGVKDGVYWDSPPEVKELADAAANVVGTLALIRVNANSPWFRRMMAN